MRAAKIGISPNIYEIWFCKDKTIFIMDIIRGQTLEDYLSPENKHKTYKQKILILKKTFEALDILHQNFIIHGDAHLRNFMVKPDDEISIIDFGDSLQIKEDHFLLNSDNLTLTTDIIKTFNIYGKELLKESKKLSKNLSPKRNTEEEYKRRQPLKVEEVQKSPEKEVQKSPKKEVQKKSPELKTDSAIFNKIIENLDYLTDVSESDINDQIEKYKNISKKEIMKKKLLKKYEIT